MTVERHRIAKRMSQIVIHGDTVYLAGQVGQNTAGGTAAEQTQDIVFERSEVSV